MSAGGKERPGRESSRNPRGCGTILKRRISVRPLPGVRSANRRRAPLSRGNRHALRPNRRLPASRLSCREAAKGNRQTVCKPGSVPAERTMAIHLGRPSPDASRDLPGRRRENPPADIRPLAASTRSCSRWGLPCRRRCRQRGAPLPHPFTLACCVFRETGAGGLLSVALSLGSPPPGVTRHRVPVEPGLSSLRQVSRLRRAAIRPSDDPEMGRALAAVKPTGLDSCRSPARNEPAADGQRQGKRRRGGFRRSASEAARTSQAIDSRAMTDATEAG